MYDVALTNYLIQFKLEHPYEYWKEKELLEKGLEEEFKDCSYESMLYSMKRLELNYWFNDDFRKFILEFNPELKTSLD